jgi:hypothetical protein
MIINYNNVRKESTTAALFNNFRTPPPLNGVLSSTTLKFIF